MRSRLRRNALEPLAAVVIAALLVGPSAAGAASGTTRLLVKFKPTASPEARTSLLGSVHAKQVGSVHDLGIKVVNVPSGSANAAAKAMRGSPLVAFVEPDAILEPQDNLPSDPSFPTSFGVAGGAWGWSQTHTTQAWDVTRGDPNVVIAILDTGIKTAGLSDFAGQIASTYNAMTGTTDATTNAGNHGTYVAGVAGLAMDNATGNAGFCPGCRLMIVQVGTDSGASLSDIANGLTYAADHGARVANMSWAGTADSATLRAATTYAHQHGVVMTAAAGNSNCDCATYPASDPYVLGVAGVDNSGNKSGDSNYGKWVAVAAPEGDMTAWPTINGSPGYAPVGGTSSAAPVVAGTAGLLFSANPSLTNTQVEQALESSAAPVGFSVSYGRVDALAALQSLGLGDPQAQSAPVNVSAPQLFVETNGAYGYQALAAAPQVGQVLLRGQGSWTGSAPLSISAVQWQRCNSSGSSCATVANAATYTVQSADTGYSLRLLVTVKNGLGSVAVASPLSAPVGGTTTPSPPVNSTAPSISGLPQAGQTLTASPGSWTGSPTDYAYQWEDCDTSGGSCTAIAGASSSSYTAQAGDVGDTLRVVVTASNSGGSTTATSAATGVVTASPPPPPSTQTSTFSGSLNARNPSRSFSVAVGAGAASAQLAFSKCSVLSLGLSNGASANGPSIVSLNATLAAGSYTYTVSGGKCSFTLTVVSPSP
ncbi:MAG TPA: S8 family serine peptidase [Gaiellaceae bacterium]|nr:S8 family serine peptidase [Gaiellaceae bacterium]